MEEIYLVPCVRILVPIFAENGRIFCLQTWQKTQEIASYLAKGIFADHAFLPISEFFHRCKCKNVAN